MLKVIADNPQKYPLDLIVYFDLEIAWEWEKQIAKQFEEQFKKAGIKFVRIKPRRTFSELYDKYDIPTRRCRWCNSDYKLDCKKQLEQWIVEQNCRPVAYIGFCADEQRRFKYELGNWEQQDVCYPLAEEGITEDVILKWAREQPMFNGWYKHFDRAGCMYCPMLSRKELAYLKLHYPAKWELFRNAIGKYEAKYNTTLFGADISLIEYRLDKEWIPRLIEEEIDVDRFKQTDIFDFMEG